MINKETAGSTSIISELSHTVHFGRTLATKDVRYGTTISGSDAASIFEFAANNSNVEWIVSAHNNFSDYVVGSSHVENTKGIEVVAPVGELIYCAANTNFIMHSHPFTNRPSDHDKSAVKDNTYINYIYFSGRPGMTEGRGDVTRFNERINIPQVNYINKLEQFQMFKNGK